TAPAAERKLTVVIDGLDEALGWAPPFPLQPLPHGVFVVLSARTVARKDWMSDLRLPRESTEVLELGALGRSQIISLLRAGGATSARWAGDSLFVDTLASKSAGDPFY